MGNLVSTFFSEGGECKDGVSQNSENTLNYFCTYWTC